METSFSRSRIVEMKNRLRELEIPFKSNLKKRDLYDLLAARAVSAPIETSIPKILAIVKIQAAWRGRYTRKMLALRGNAAFNRELCSNDIDPISLDPIKDLPMRTFFSYMADDGRYYGFDITSLKKCLDNEQLKNPFNREEFSFETLHRIHVCYETRVPIVSLSKSGRTGSKVDTRTKAFEIFHNFHLASGFFIDENWFLNLQRPDLIAFFKKLYHIIRVRSPSAFYEMCEEEDTSVFGFFDLYDNICAGMYNTAKMRQMILKELENLVETQEDKITAIIWILLALTQASESAAMGLPFLA